MAKKKKKINFKKKIKAYFKTTKPILVALIILLVVLVCFCWHLMNVSKSYMFSGRSEFVSIYNGVISLNYDMHVFMGSDIRYHYEDDFIVTEYKIGYILIDDKANITELVTRTGSFEEGFLLSNLIHEVSAFNFTEPFHNKVRFNRETIRNLENELRFIIEATTEDGEKISDIVEINIHRVSK